MPIKKAATKTAAKAAAKSATGTAAKKAPVKKAAAKKVAAKKTAKKAAAPRKTAPVVIEEDFEPSPSGGTALVIVESPAKAKTIGKYLGRSYTVRATVGHVRDLPAKKLGIDIDKGFAPEYVTIEGKEDILTDLKRIAKGAREIFIATDPDREGEAIGWHVEQYFTQPKRHAVTAPIRRVMFHEITKDAVHKSMAKPMDIDNRKVEAQQARRVLDRLVGYKASPVLWKTVKKGLSAGRVQTVALRIIVEREREIRAFTPVEYWTIAADLQKGAQAFVAKLHQVDGKKPELPNGPEAERVIADLKGRKQFTVTEVKRRERRKNPAAPFTTSTLQQEAAKKLGFGSKRTMRLAQDLYEGIDIGGEDGAVGLITYMRTDSSRVSEASAGAARDWLRAEHGVRRAPPDRRDLRRRICRPPSRARLDPDPHPVAERLRARLQRRWRARYPRSLHLPARHQCGRAPGHTLLARLRAAGQRRRHHALRPGAGRRSGCHPLRFPRTVRGCTSPASAAAA